MELVGNTYQPQRIVLRNNGKTAESFCKHGNLGYHHIIRPVVVDHLQYAENNTGNCKQPTQTNTAMIQWYYLLKMVYRVSIFLIWFLIAFPIAWRFIPLDFASQGIESDFETTCFFTFISATLATLTGTLKKADHAAIVILKILLTLFAAFCSLVIIGLFALGSMCGSVTTNTLFVKKGNSNISIVTREFGCGATDSGPATKSTKKLRKITSFFIWLTPVDTNMINKEHWIRLVQK
jgi:hypothetical protein